MNFLDYFNFLSLDNLYVQHTLYAFACFGLGLLGMFLGQRLTNDKVSMLFGLILGGLTIFLLFTPWGFLAPGACGVIVVTFLTTGYLTRFLGVSGKSAKSQDGNNPSTGA